MYLKKGILLNIHVPALFSLSKFFFFLLVCLYGQTLKNMSSIGQVLNPERESGISLCHHHGNNEVIYTCNDCDGTMACAECVTSIHQGHSLHKLKDTATSVWENLVSCYISKAEKLEIPKVIKEMKIADGRIQANRKHFQELVAEIQNRGEILKNEVDKNYNENGRVCNTSSERKCRMSQGLQKGA